MEREGRWGWNRTGKGERGGRRERGGKRGTEIKKSPLVEDVLEYRDFYEGEGAD